MFFLLRMAFWLGVVLILLPTGSTQREQAGNEIGASEAISAASATVQDMRGFCARQPDACSVGSQVAVSLGYRAEAGAKMLYGFLTEKLAAHNAGMPARTGSIAKTGQGEATPASVSQNTLTPADLIPAWRGSPVRKEIKHSV